MHFKKAGSFNPGVRGSFPREGQNGIKKAMLCIKAHRKKPKAPRQGFEPRT
jgi:hypothetical protein